MSEETLPTEKRVRVNHHYPESIDTKVANHFIIQHNLEGFTLSFFEIRQPILLDGTKEERLAQLNELTEVDAKCVASLAITPSNMYEFMNAIQENFRNFERRASAFSDLDESEDNESE